MKNILKIFKIDFSFYFFIFLFLITGFVKDAFIISIVVIFHELGHVFFTKIFNYRIEKVSLYIFGGITTINKPLNSSFWQDFFISVGGIFNQLLLGVLFKILTTWEIFSQDFYNLFSYYNLLILFFNLLPICPLDGYKILFSFLNLFCSFYYSIIISVIISFIFYGCFVFYLWSQNYLNPFILFFLLYSIFKLYKDRKFYLYSFLMEHYLKVISFSKKKFIMNLNDKRFYKDTYHYFKLNDKILSESYWLAKRFDNK